MYPIPGVHRMMVYYFIIALQVPLRKGILKFRRIRFREYAILSEFAGDGLNCCVSVLKEV